MIQVEKERGMFNMQLNNYIDGKWQEEGHGNYTAVKNPANGEEVAQVRLSTSEDVDQAVMAAKKAQKKWALVPAPKRADFLYEIGRIMKREKRTFSPSAHD